MASRALVHRAGHQVGHANRAARHGAQEVDNRPASLVHASQGEVVDAWNQVAHRDTRLDVGAEHRVQQAVRDELARAGCELLEGLDDGPFERAGLDTERAAEQLDDVEQVLRERHTEHTRAEPQRAEHGHPASRGHVLHVLHHRNEDHLVDERILHKAGPGERGAVVPREVALRMVDGFDSLVEGLLIQRLALRHTKRAEPVLASSKAACAAVRRACASV